MVIATSVQYKKFSRSVDGAEPVSRGSVVTCGWLLVILLFMISTFFSNSGLAKEVVLTTYFPEPSGSYTTVSYDTASFDDLKANNVTVDNGYNYNLNYKPGLYTFSAANALFIERPDATISEWNSANTNAPVVVHGGGYRGEYDYVSGYVSLQSRSTESGNPLRKYWFAGYYHGSGTGGQGYADFQICRSNPETTGSPGMGHFCPTNDFYISEIPAWQTSWVSIGSTSSMSSGLVVNGSVRMQGILLANSDATNNFSFGINNNNNALAIGHGTSPGNDNDFVLDQNGNVGIGVTAPQSKLDVNGDLNFAGLMYLSNERRNDSGGYIPVGANFGWWVYSTPPTMMLSGYDNMYDSAHLYPGVSVESEVKFNGNAGTLQYVNDHMNYSGSPLPATPSFTFSIQTCTPALNAGIFSCTTTCPGSGKVISGGFSSPATNQGPPPQEDGQYAVESYPGDLAHNAANNTNQWTCKVTHKWLFTAGQWTRSDPTGGSCYAVCVQ